ncbi:MAG: GNAT family N-acetyltransferase [Anaerolineaceae bacterium]|nr:GNAT family N-acetyltransferase [Anaerolineaceae bacterium]
MPPIIIRLATQADLPDVAALWVEKIILLQQLDARFRLQPDAESRFSQTAAAWLEAPDTRLLVAIRDGLVAGFVTAQIQANWPGLQPEKLGAVTHLAIDSHGQPGGIGRLLLDAVREWFTQVGIQQMIVHVPQRFAIEQAFWRASGAAEWIDLLWMNL